MGLFRKKKNDAAPSPEAPESSEPVAPGRDAANAPAEPTLSPPAPPAQDAPPIDDEFTDLAERAPTDAQASADLWERVFKLEAWHFIPSVPPGETLEGMMAGGKPIGPLVASVEGASYYMAFTSPARAVACARANGLALVADGEGFSTMSVPVESAIVSLCAAPDPRLTGLMFNRNAGVRAFFSTFDTLAAMYEMYADRMPIPLFDRFVQAVSDANHDVAWNRLHRRVALHPEWHFFADPGAPTRPLMMNFSGTSVVLLFTDEARLAKCRALLQQQAPPGGGPDLSGHRAGAAEMATSIASLASASGGLAGAGEPEVLINMGSSSIRYRLQTLAQVMAQVQRPG